MAHSNAVNLPASGKQVILYVDWDEASDHAQIISGKAGTQGGPEPLATSMGKIAKWKTDFTKLVFTDLSISGGAADTGKAITSLSYDKTTGIITATKGTFLTAHPSTSTSTDTTSTASPTHGGTFTAVDSVERDSFGHVKKINTKTVTLPSDQNTDTKVTQTNTTGDANYRVLFSANANDTTETTTSRKSANLIFNPNNGALVIGSSTQSSYPTGGIWIHDIRTTTVTPTNGDKMVNFYFHHAVADTYPDAAPTTAWWSIMHVRGWTGNYNTWELAGPANNGDQSIVPLYVRSSKVANSAVIWGSWRKIYDTSNPPTYSEVGAAAASHSHSEYIPKTGATDISGSLETNSTSAGFVVPGSSDGRKMSLMNGNVTLTIGTSNWSNGINFYKTSVLGTIGAYGTSSTCDYFFMGKAYNNYSMRVENDDTGKMTLRGTLPQLKFQQTTSGSAYDNGNAGIKAYPATNTSGMNMTIQSGGNMIIGAGEYPTNFYNLADKTTGYPNYWETTSEYMFIGSDNYVVIHTKADTIANKKTFVFGANFNLAVGAKIVFKTNTEASPVEHNLTTSATTTARTWTLPNATGTIALTSDIPNTVYVTANTPTSSTMFCIPFFEESDPASGNKSLKANNGLRGYSYNGGANVEGYGYLVLGNSAKLSVANNKTGILRLYSAGDKYINIRPISGETAITANRTIGLPDASGTVALKEIATGWTYIKSRDYAGIYANSNAGTASSTFYTAAFIKTNTGGWSIGTLPSNDKLYFLWTTDANYTANSNNYTAWTIDSDGLFNGTAEYSNRGKHVLTDPNSEVYYGLTIHASAGTEEQKYFRTNNGLRAITRIGTTSQRGYGFVVLGNATASGTDGNKYGGVRIYNSGTKYVQISGTNDNYLSFSSSTATAGDGIIPVTTAVYDLGASDNLWRKIYCSYGLYLRDSANNVYGGIIDNGSNLWIGAYQTAATHHVGSTIISAGYDGSNGNPTIHVSVPNATNTNATNFPILHSGLGVGKNGFISFPNDGEYTASASDVTGALVITCPFGMTSCMMSFTVDIFNYVDNDCVSYRISGYNYSTGPKWVNCSASSFGDGTKANLTVRFGYNGTKAQIQIGETNTGWKWPQVRIRDIMLGHTDATNKTFITNRTGWTVTFETTNISNVTKTLTDTRVYALTSHTHNYAGSSSAGGAATSANKLNTNAGSTTQPVYFSGGVPVATTYALNKTVPSDAVFTDANVTQTNTTGDANYRVLFSANANDTTETTTARKSSGLIFNPSTKVLSTGRLSLTSATTPSITVDLDTLQATAGQNVNIMCVKFKNTDGTKTHTVYPIGIIGNDATGDTAAYNSGVRLGSTNGTTVVAAGESSTTFAAAQAKYTDENLYLVADGNVLLYRGMSNDATTGSGPWTVGGFTATPTSGNVMIADGTNGGYKTSSYTIAKSVPSDAVFKYSAGTGLSLSGTTFNHSNSVTEVTTEGMLKVKYDAQGHITGSSAFAQADVNTLINLLGTGNSTPVDADYYISQYVNGGTTTTTYHRRPMSALWSYVKGKADSVYAPLSHNHAAGDITSGTLPIAQGGTGATTRLDALKALTNENVGTSAQYFLTITTSWGKGGYTSVANAKTVLGLGSAAYTASTDYAPAVHTHSYLPLTGGTLTGNLSVSNGAGSKVSVTNTTYEVGLLIGSGGTNRGLYDFNTTSGANKWLVYIDSSNNVYLNGTANKAQQITTNAGSTTQPVYFSGGVPVAITSSVVATPSSAVSTNWSTTTQRTDIITKGWLSYWDGSYDSTSHATNLKYIKATKEESTSEAVRYIPFHTSAATGSSSLLTNDGIGYTYKQGTASVTGYSYLILGNATSGGTAGNKYGLIRIYDTGTKYMNLRCAGAMTNSGKDIYLPDKSEACTLAALDDIPSAGSWTTLAGASWTDKSKITQADSTMYYINFRDGFVEICGKFKLASANTSVRITTIAAAYRPSNIMRFGSIYTSGNTLLNGASICITTAGVIDIVGSSNTTFSTGSTYYFYLRFVK